MTYSKHYLGVLMTVSLLGAVTSGCQQDESTTQVSDQPSMTIDETAISSAESVMLAKVDTSDGGYVAWYEPVPGVIVVGEMGKYPNLSVADKLGSDGGLGTPEDIYRALAPNSPIPDKMSKAMERRDYYGGLTASLGKSIAVRTEAAKKSTATSEVGVARQAAQDPIADDSACPWSWFYQARCGCIGSQCTVLAYQTGTTSFTYSDKNYFTSSACAYRGTVRLIGSYKTWWSWTRAYDVQVPTGWYYYWWHDNTMFDFDASSWVQEADGDGYHHCGTGGW